MRLYHAMSALPRPASYLGKIVVVSFIGVHVPLVAAVAYVLLSADLSLDRSLDILVVLLLATLAGTAATLWALYQLLGPVGASARALRDYLERRSIPSLPTRYRDRAGVLMANVQEAITRLDMALDSAQAQRDEALRIHREKFELLASMSHDLRTPLNHVIGFAEVISTEALGPLGTRSYRSYAEDIRDSGGGLLSTLQTVLDLSEAEAGRLQIEAEVQDLDAAVRRAVNLAHHQAEGSGIRLAAPSLPPQRIAVLSDGRSLKQILIHALQVVLAGGATSASVQLSRDAAAGTANVTLRSDAPWGEYDVPPELLQAGAAAAGDFPSSNPAALRLSLIASLSRLTGARLQVGTIGGGGRQLAIGLPLAAAEQSRDAA